MGIYQQCFDLVQRYIYGGAELTSDMSLVATLIATIACITVFALPFVVVFKVIDIITGGWK